MAVLVMGAAGAGGYDEVGNLSVRLFCDLRAGGLVMCVAVGQIIVLVGVERTGDLSGEAARNGVIGPGVFRRDIGRADDYFGAKGFEDIDLFF